MNKIDQEKKFKIAYHILNIFSLILVPMHYKIKTALK